MNESVISNDASCVTDILIGQGTYSCIYKYKGFAIKVMNSKSAFIRELTFVRLLRHPNIIRINKACFDNLRTSMPLYDMNLWKLVRDKVPFDKIKVLSSILKGLNHIHQSGVIHCDLNPNNVLVNVNVNVNVNEVVIADFNMSCFDAIDQRSILVQTNGFDDPRIAEQKRKYEREEEFDAVKYSFEIDIWSFGCIVLFINRIKHIDIHTLCSDDLKDLVLEGVFIELLFASLIDRKGIDALNDILGIEIEPIEPIDLSIFTEDEIKLLSGQRTDWTSRVKNRNQRNLVNKILSDIVSIQ
jgi:serine/threonine protein kinase